MVYLAPEMLMSPRFLALLAKSTFRKRLLAIVVDECHVISEWGDEFRPFYRQLERLRSYTGTEVPFVACSATVSTDMFRTIWKSLAFGTRPFWGIDVGSDRPNLLYLIRQASDPKNPVLDVLSFLPKILDENTTPQDIPKCLLYFETQDQCRVAVDTLRKCLPPHLRDFVYPFSSIHSEKAKQKCWDLFMDGQRLRIICATDACGMGCNVPDVKVVLICGCPKSAAAVSQRWGRAGRNRVLPSVCLLTVPSWACRPIPAGIGTASQVVYLQGKKKKPLEPKTWAARRSKLHRPLEELINQNQEPFGGRIPFVLYGSEVLTQHVP